MSLKGRIKRKKRTVFSVRNADALDCYSSWPTPTVIISDGPYGLGLRGGYAGDGVDVDGLPSFYSPHVLYWSKCAAPSTTLWFWGSEESWALMHAVLKGNGWVYRACHVWDKGLTHVAGRTSTKSLRCLPVVTEVCAQYVRNTEYSEFSGDSLQMWLRREWDRTGLKLQDANVACGVKDAAKRRYLTRSSLWYPPPEEMFERIRAYANKYGDAKGRPYFDRKTAPKELRGWLATCPVFHCPSGVTNVWRVNPVRGEERLKVNGKPAHPNQKPSELMRLIVSLSSDPGDVVWDPFGGLFTGVLAAVQLGRKGYGAEIRPKIFAVGRKRLEVACGG